MTFWQEKFIIKYVGFSQQNQVQIVKNFLSQNVNMSLKIHNFENIKLLCHLQYEVNNSAIRKGVICQILYTTIYL